MKTETLIKAIILGSIFCFIMLMFPIAVPLNKYLPPISPAEKCDAAIMDLQNFDSDLIKVIPYKPVPNGENANRILSKVIKKKKDPWGSQYWYKVIKWDITNLSIKVLFGSSGPDKKPNTKDDITRLYDL